MVFEKEFDSIVSKIDFWVILVTSAIILIVIYEFTTSPDEYLNPIIAYCLMVLSITSMKNHHITKRIRQKAELMEYCRKNSRFGANDTLWMWYSEDGRVTVGGMPNVTLRALTVQKLLNTFKGAENYGKKIKDVAYEIGESFSISLQQLLGNEYPTNMQERLHKWISYDTDTGMGKFHYTDIIIDGAGKINAGAKIIIQNSFIVIGRSINNDKECKFYEGYIEGVFHEFIGIDVDVKEISCGVNGLCTFLVTNR